MRTGSVSRRRQHQGSVPRRQGVILPVMSKRYAIPEGLAWLVAQQLELSHNEPGEHWESLREIQLCNQWANMAAALSMRHAKPLFETPLKAPPCQGSGRGGARLALPLQDAEGSVVRGLPISWWYDLC